MLLNATDRLPATVAAPLTWRDARAGGSAGVAVPPTVMANSEFVPEAVNAPATCRVAPASRAISPSLDNAPAVVNCRSASREKPPWLSFRLLKAGNVEFGPRRKHVRLVAC